MAEYEHSPDCTQFASEVDQHADGSTGKDPDFVEVQDKFPDSLLLDQTVERLPSVEADLGAGEPDDGEISSVLDTRRRRGNFTHESFPLCREGYQRDALGSEPCRESLNRLIDSSSRPFRNLQGSAKGRGGDE